MSRSQYILDTNIVSYYLRGDDRVTQPLQRLSPSQVAVPAIVEYELRFGLLRLKGKTARARINALDAFLSPITILAFDSDCANHAARIRVALEVKGTPIGPHDILIAATALGYQAKLVTRNQDEFSRVPGLEWVNWHNS